MNRKDFIISGCKACVALTTTSLLSSLLSSCSTTSVYKATAIENIIQIPKSIFLPEEKYKIIRSSNTEFDILLRLMPDGNYSSILMQCTHAINALSATKNGFICNMHGSQFNADGVVVQGPAIRNLLHYHTTSDNDKITIHLTKTS